MVPVGTQGINLTCCMTFGPDENLYVSSPFFSSVLRVNGVTGAFIDTFIPTGSGGLMVPPILLCHEGYVYVGDTGAGAIVDNFIPDNSQRLGEIPGDLQFFAFGPDRDLYVTATSSTRILRYNGQTGTFMMTLFPLAKALLRMG